MEKGRQTELVAPPADGDALVWGDAMNMTVWVSVTVIGVLGLTLCFIENSSPKSVQKSTRKFIYLKNNVLIGMAYEYDGIPPKWPLGKPDYDMIYEVKQ